MGMFSLDKSMTIAALVLLSLAFTSVSLLARRFIAGRRAARNVTLRRQGKPSWTEDELPDKVTPRVSASGASVSVVINRGEGRIERDGFHALMPSQLKPIAVMVQALDDRWFPRTLFDRFVIARGERQREQARVRRNRLARAEYLRALVNAEQVVINRANLHGSEVVSRDYVTSSQQRDAFLTLIAGGTIVPYLLAEHTPLELPTTRSEVPRRPFDAWQQVCLEVAPQCVRLSWDDQSNSQYVNRLGRSFTAFLMMLPVMLSSPGGSELLLTALGIPASDRMDFIAQANEIPRWVQDEVQPVTRDAFYRRYLTEHSTSPIEQRYNAQQRFVAPLKQLADLFYNLGLTDALSRFVMTPQESLPRYALGELGILGDNATETPPEVFQELLQQTVFSLASDGLYLAAIDEMTLADVRELRDTHEWYGYIQAMHALLAHPLDFTTRVAAVYKSYIAVAQRATAIISRKRADVAVSRWSPGITLAVSIGGAVVNAACTVSANSLGASVLYNVMGNTAQAGAEYVVKLIIHGLASRRVEDDFSTSLDILRGKVRDAQATWEAIEHTLRTNRAFLDVGPAYQRLPELAAHKAPTINYSAK